jgi:GT2 family glycosyltransferase
MSEHPPGGSPSGIAPTVSVIIVNYNSGDRIARCLDRLSAQSFRDFETIVIDNASADGSLEIARRHSIGVRIIEAGSNIGFAAGNNRAAVAARGEWLVFLNPDAYAEPDWLEKLIAASGRYPWADAFGSAQLIADQPELLDGAGDVYHILGVAYRGGFRQPATRLIADGECFAPCAAAAMYRKSVFERLGGFDERFFCYGEDVDLGFRLRLAGGRAIQLKDARVLHEGSGVTGRYSDFTVYHGNRNRIWLTYKNMPGVFYWSMFPVRLAFDAYLFVRAIMIGTGGAYARAMRDGYGGLRAFAADRRQLQADRKLSAWAFGRIAAWSPISMLQRRIDLKPAAGPARLEPIAANRE